MAEVADTVTLGFYPFSFIPSHFHFHIPHILCHCAWGGIAFTYHPPHCRIKGYMKYGERNGTRYTLLGRGGGVQDYPWESHLRDVRKICWSMSGSFRAGMFRGGWCSRGWERGRGVLGRVFSVFSKGLFKFLLLKQQSLFASAVAVTRVITTGITVRTPLCQSFILFGWDGVGRGVQNFVCCIDKHIGARGTCC